MKKIKKSCRNCSKKDICSKSNKKRKNKDNPEIIVHKGSIEDAESISKLALLELLQECQEEQNSNCKEFLSFYSKWLKKFTELEMKIEEIQKELGIL